MSDRASKVTRSGTQPDVYDYIAAAIFNGDRAERALAEIVEGVITALDANVVVRFDGYADTNDIAQVLSAELPKALGRAVALIVSEATHG